MNTCPHCGASLWDDARFCPHCMTVLNEKRVVPTPKYAMRRWLSAMAAVLVFLLTISGVWVVDNALPDTEDTGAATTAYTTAATATQIYHPAPSAATGTVATSSTTLTTLASFFESHPTQDIPVTTPSSTTTTTTTTRTYPTPTTTASQTSTSKTSTTTTTTTTTTTQTTTTTKPYWLDATPGAVTEDGLPIEEVQWTYERITSDSFWFGRCMNCDYPNLSGSGDRRYTTPSGVPLNQCIKVTGCVGTTSNGIYRVPATIDGYVVAMVDFGTSFADTATALTVKRIYLPPDAIALQGGIDKCTKLERLYTTSTEFWVRPDYLPNCGTYSWGGVTYYNLSFYIPSKFTPLYIQNYSPYVWLYACKGNVYDTEAKSLTNKQCQALYGGGV